MIDIFMRSPLPNTLAVLVLIALAVTWVTSIVLSLSSTSRVMENGWFEKLLPVLSILGLPAAWDLLQTQGVTFLFAAIVLIVLLLNIILPILKMAGKTSHPLVMDWYKWSVLLSCLGGLAVAGYLTFIESTGGPVACGPSGGCDTVQNSRYATLFGFLPIGVLGLMGYIAILACWVALHFGPGAIKKLASISIWGMCIFGVLFSIYLTFLEPFVIGATCMWCILSAVLMITLLLLTTPDAQQAFAFTDE
jgi:uncharacterized membrane protein